MLIEERLAKIQKIVNEQKSISMEALAEQVSVSKDTIRRDLIRLEKEGHLKRTHGGAISVQSEATIYDYAQRIMKHPEKKQAIAQKVWANIPKLFGQIFPNKRPFFLIHQPRWKQLFERWKIVRFTRSRTLSVMRYF